MATKSLIKWDNHDTWDDVIANEAAAEGMRLVVRVLYFTARGHHTYSRSVLLLQRSPNASRGGQWELPGGKAERGERIAGALIRELQEETLLPAAFIDLRQYASILGIISPMDHPRGKFHTWLTVMVPVGVELGTDARGQTRRARKPTLSDEHVAYRWVKYPEALKMDLTDYARMIIEECLKTQVKQQVESCISHFREYHPAAPDSKVLDYVRKCRIDDRVHFPRWEKTIFEESLASLPVYPEDSTLPWTGECRFTRVPSK